MGNKGMTESATENWIIMSHIDDGDETLLSSYNMHLYGFYAALHPAAKNNLRIWVRVGFTLHFWMRMSTIDGSESVVTSPISSVWLFEIFLKMRRMIFPERVFGRPGTKMIWPGAANLASLFRTNETSSARIFSSESGLMSDLRIE